MTFSGEMTQALEKVWTIWIILIWIVAAAGSVVS